MTITIIFSTTKQKKCGKFCLGRRDLQCEMTSDYKTIRIKAIITPAVYFFSDYSARRIPPTIANKKGVHYGREMERILFIQYTL